MFPIPQKHGLYVSVESAPETIRLLNSVFRPALIAAFQSFSSTAHRHPSKRLAAGAAEEKEAQAALIRAAIIRVGGSFVVAPLLGGTPGLSLAFDVL